MNFKIRYSTVIPMIELCEKLKEGTASRDEFKQLIQNDDYQVEFQRYKGRLTENEFLDYIMNALNLGEDDIKNMDLKAHHENFLYFLNHLDFYKDKFSKFIKEITPEFAQKRIAVTLNGLPGDIEMPDANYVFTIGIGQSNGYIYENNLVFDVIQTLRKDMSIDEFGAVFSHETHHLGMDASAFKGIDESKLTAQELFLLSFAGEGLAVKFCNNAEGILSKSIYEGQKNVGLDKFTWDYLNNDFEDTMNHFRNTMNNIKSGTFTLQDVINDLNDYWTSPYVQGQKKDEVPKLRHFRCYSFGNEIWGLIYDCFGKEVLYDTIKHVDRFPEIFNKALDKAGHPKYKIS